MKVNFTSKRFEYVALACILLVTTLVYLNHFENTFFYDDSHTIENNESIRSIDVVDFFTNAETFSSLPANRSYRPLITLMNAIDYNIAGGLKSTIFHYHIFFWFLILIILVFFLLKNIYSLSEEHNKWNSIVAIFATSWFALHTANAETINYICARSDSFSTLCIVASLLLYMHPFAKKFYLYLVTMLIGIWTKQTGVMFIPILLTYIVLFEEYTILDNFKTNTKQKLLKIGKKMLPALVFGTFLFLFNQFYLTPDTTDSTNFRVTRFEYVITQCYVVMHYLGNFILPIKLSPDPDIAIIKPWYDKRILLGLIIIIGLLFTAFKTSFIKKYRPIAFGILWFFIALVPTSLNPLFQIANDHRMFFPFIGLFLAVTWCVFLILNKYNVLQKPSNIRLVSILLFLILGSHAYGTMQRNKVWRTKESLWKEVATKSPKNPRGLMNYGLTQMEKKNYNEALKHFKKAYKYTPNYYSLHINFGVLYAAKKDYRKAEKFFKSAIALNSSSCSPEYFYGRYLYKRRRYREAKKFADKALAKSPNHIGSKKLVALLLKKTKKRKKKKFSTRK